jgi:hypothetical protein
MKIQIKTGYHKAADKWAMSAAQYKFILSLGTERIKGWDFPSTSQAMRYLTKSGASEIIDALKNGDEVELT